MSKFNKLITYTRDYFALPESVPIIADILQDVECTDNPLVITNLQDPYAPADNTTYAKPVDPKTWPETAKKLNQSLHVLVSCAFGGPLVSNLLDTHQSARLYFSAAMRLIYVQWIKRDAHTLMMTSYQCIVEAITRRTRSTPQETQSMITKLSLDWETKKATKTPTTIGLACLTTCT